MRVIYQAAFLQEASYMIDRAWSGCSALLCIAADWRAALVDLLGRRDCQLVTLANSGPMESGGGRVAMLPMARSI